MSIAGAEVKPFQRHAVAEIWEQRPEQELTMPGIASPSQITADQVGVHGLKLIGGDRAPSPNAGPKSWSQSFDPGIDAIAERIGMSCPAP
jgi:hypothetical protein